MNVTYFSRLSEHKDVIENHVLFTVCEHFDLKLQNWPQGYKTFFMLNSIEHEIFPAHKC